MKLLEVTDQATAKEFLKLPLKIYQNDPLWVRPLDKEINHIFDKNFNPRFQQGECIRWILQDENKQTIGRIAAFYDARTSAKESQPTGGLGFFECINQQEAAFLLFDAAQEWLKSKGMEAMDGPVNFGDRDRWWGLLVEGNKSASYGQNYHPKYYQPFFEAYGFKDYFKQFTYQTGVKGDELTEAFYAKYERIMKNPSYLIKHIEKKNLDKYIEDFRTVYNKSWVLHEGVAEMTTAQARKILHEMKPILDERLVWFAYYNNEPVGFMVMIPELNQLFKYVNGKMDWIGIARFLYYKWAKKCNTALGLVIGFLPRFQGRGLESAMIVEFSKLAYLPDFPYKTMEFNWVGDFLPAMGAIYESFGAKIVKTHITYRKLFDETKEFHRHPIIK